VTPILTLVSPSPTLKAVEVQLPQNQEARLNDLAARTGKTPDDLIREAIARLLDHDEWFKEQVQVAMDQIARGEFIEEEEMDARIERRLQS
jgi:predicted transcriptional regulator